MPWNNCFRRDARNNICCGCPVGIAAEAFHNTDVSLNGGLQ